MKKFLAVLLATAILLSVCAFSVFAADRTSTNEQGQLSYYYVDEDELTVEGWTVLELNLGKSIFYGVTITNHEEARIVYDGYIQCVATFSDGSMDIDTYSESVPIASAHSGNVSQFLFLNPGKTLVSIDAEFQVSSSGYQKWEGSLSKAYTPGIDL